MSVFDKAHEERKEEEEEEEEEEEDIIQNEEPLQPIDSMFNDLVLNTKKSLYKNIVLGPPLNTKKAQDNKLLVSYLQKLTSLRRLCLYVQYHTLSEKNLNKLIEEYPNETRNMIKILVQWLAVFFNKNNAGDIIRCVDPLKRKLFSHPLVQN